MTKPNLTFSHFWVFSSMLITNMCDFLGFQDILWAKTEFEILSLRHLDLTNKRLTLCSKIGYFGVAGVKLHTDAHSCHMNQNDP